MSNPPIYLHGRGLYLWPLPLPNAALRSLHSSTQHLTVVLHYSIGKVKVYHTPQKGIGRCSYPSRRPLAHRWRPVSEMTYTVSSGTLNPSIPYHTHRWRTTSLTRGHCDARPTVTFPDARRHPPLAGTKSYCLVTEAHVY